MDKYEFNIKVEQIKKLVNKGDYETAMKIADGIDWRRVRSTSLLASISQVYERNEEYQEAKDILLLAFERAPSGRGLLFKLTDLALREGNVPEAEAYYREFCDLCGDDPRQNLLRYLILEAKKAPLDQLITSLERYCQDEIDEKWLYRLAKLYQEAGREEDCVRICDKIMLLFGLGKYVDKAMELKTKYAPLTKYQMDLVENREKYEEKLRAVEEEYSSGRRHIEDEGDLDQEDYDAGDADASGESAGEDRSGGPERRIREEAREDRAGAEAGGKEKGFGTALHEERAERELAREIAKIPREEYREEADAAGETRILGDIRSIKRQAEENAVSGAAAGSVLAGAAAGATAGIRAVRSIRAEKAAGTAGSAAGYGAEQAGAGTIGSAAPGRRIDGAFEEKVPAGNAAGAAAGQEPSRGGRGGAAAWAGASREEFAAAREEQIAREYEEEEETIIEDWDLEPDENESNHLMIEADDPQSGLALALDSLKKIHRELGTKSPVAKISAQNLNRRGIFSVADRLTGKDLIVEHAADLDDFSVRDLSELMEADKSGMIVVLIDTPARMERFHNGNPELAGKFQYIGCRAFENAEDREEQEARRRQAAAAAEAARRQAEYEAEQERKRLAEAAAAEEARRRAEYEAELARKQREEEEARQRKEEEDLRREEEARQKEIDAELERQRLAEYAAETARMEQASGAQGGAKDSGYAQENSRDENGYAAQEGYRGENGYADREDYRSGNGYADRESYQSESGGADREDYRGENGYDSQENLHGGDGRGVREDYRGDGGYGDRERFEDDGRYEENGSREDDGYADGGYDGHYDEAWDGDGGYDPKGAGQEMDVEEFAQYACKYASEIDCSISGKSMLALYERAEMMEEDGIPLTRESAEDLIEEAADRAEKPSFGGFFSSKYDKDGLLILKEKHFFD